MSNDKERALALFPVSRETEHLLEIYANTLLDWQRVKNLVGRSTLDQIWTRHIADSAQLLKFVPQDATHWVDLGSGAGFPGIVMAILLRDRPGMEVHLVESDGRKAAFLRAAARATGAPVYVHNGRIEAVLPALPGPVDVVSARALAPLPDLLHMSHDLLAAGALGIFPKGQDLESELTNHTKYSINIFPSLTDPRASVVLARIGEAA